MEQLLESLQLAFVVAENEVRKIAGEETTESLEVAIHSVRRQKSSLELGRLIPERKPRELMKASLPSFRRLENFFPRWHVLPQAPRDHQMVFGLSPGAGYFFPIGA